jgi:hypothetical protein
MLFAREPEVSDAAFLAEKYKRTKSAVSRACLLHRASWEEVRSAAGEAVPLDVLLRNAYEAIFEGRLLQSQACCLDWMAMLGADCYLARANEWAEDVHLQMWGYGKAYTVFGGLPRRQLQRGLDTWNDARLRIAQLPGIDLEAALRGLNQEAIWALRFAESRGHDRQRTAAEYAGKVRPWGDLVTPAPAVAYVDRSLAPASQPDPRGDAAQSPMDNAALKDISDEGWRPGYAGLEINCSWHRVRRDGREAAFSRASTQWRLLEMLVNCGARGLPTAALERAWGEDGYLPTNHAFRNSLSEVRLKLKPLSVSIVKEADRWRLVNLTPESPSS